MASALLKKLTENTFLRLFDAPVLKRVLTVLLIVYVLLPSFWIVPYEGFESRIIWESAHGIAQLNYGRRALMRFLLTHASEYFNISIWTLMAWSTALCGPIAIGLTYLVVRRFQAVSPLAFLLYAFVAPYWLISAQTLGDSSTAYLFFIMSIALALKSAWLMPLAGLAAGLAIGFRGDAMAIFGALPMALLGYAVKLRLEEGRYWNGLGDFLYDRKILMVLVQTGAFWIFLYLAGYIVGLPFKLDPIGLVRSIFADIGAYEVLPFWIVDSWLKVFTISWLVLLPFYVARTVQRARLSTWTLLELWPVVPILVYVYAYLLGMNQPRYVIYAAPFLMIMSIQAVDFMIATLRARLRWWRPLFIAGAVVLVFNPYPILMNYRGLQSNNLIERVAYNQNEHHFYSFTFSGVMPYMNLKRALSFGYCESFMKDTASNFLGSDKSTLIVFLNGGDSVNFFHQYVIETFFQKYKIPYKPLSGGDPFSKKETRLYPDKFDLVDDFSYAGKRVIFFKLDSPRTKSNEQKFLTDFVNLHTGPGKRHAPIDFATVGPIIGFNIYGAYFPEYLNPPSRCLIDSYGLADGVNFTSKAPPPENAAALAAAEPLVRKRTTSEMMLERKQQNQDWLETIPDYELRLYDRISTIKNRQVDHKRQNWLQTLLILAAIAGAACWIHPPRNLNASLKQALGQFYRNAVMCYLLANISGQLRRLDSTLRRSETAAPEIEALMAEIQATKAQIEKTMKE
jgi:hypothetical protein